MKTLFLSFILVVGIFTVDIAHFGGAQLSLLQKVQGTSWGKIMLSMGEVASETQGPLQELYEASAELVDEINQYIDDVDTQFSHTTDQFNQKSTSLEQQVNDNTIEIASNSDLLNNVLYPNKDLTINNQRRLTTNIKENRQKVKEDTLNRNKNNAVFQEKSQQHSSAIDAVDQCLQLINSIQTSGSLVQIKKLQGSVEVIEARIGSHEALGPLVINIMELTSQANFADQSILSDLKKMFNELRQSIVEELNRETAEENEAAAVFVQRLQNLNDEHSEFQRELTENVYQVAAYDRKSDLSAAQGQLTELQNWYVTETQIYNDIRAQFQQDLEALTQAQQLVNNPDFVNMLKNMIK